MMTRSRLAVAVLVMMVVAAATVHSSSVASNFDDDTADDEHQPSMFLELRDSMKVSTHVRDPSLAIFLGVSLAITLLGVGVRIANQIMTAKFVKSMNEMGVPLHQQLMEQVKEIESLTGDFDMITKRQDVAGAKIYEILRAKKVFNTDPELLREFRALFEHYGAPPDERARLSEMIQRLMRNCVQEESGILNKQKLIGEIVGAIKTAASGTKDILTTMHQHITFAGAQGGVHALAIGNAVLFSAHTMAILTHAVQPVLGIVSTSISLIANLGEAVSNFRVCHRQANVYKRELALQVRDVKYVHCRFFRDVANEMLDSTIAFETAFKQFHKQDRTSEFTAAWNEYTAPYDEMRARVLAYWRTHCTDFAKLPTLKNLHPIREIWASNHFAEQRTPPAQADNGEGTVMVSVVNQPSFFKTRKVTKVTPLRFYAPSPKQAVTSNLPATLADKTRLKEWRNGERLWHPITSIVQKYIAPGTSSYRKYFAEHAEYDGPYMQCRGLFGQTTMNPVMTSREWQRRIDIRHHVRRICTLIKPADRTPAQVSQCQSLMQDIPHPSASPNPKTGLVRQISNPDFVGGISVADWSKQGANGPAPYYNNFCGRIEYRSLIEAFKTPDAIERTAFLMMFYNRDAGAPIVDIRSGAKLGKKLKKQGDCQKKTPTAPLSKDCYVLDQDPELVGIDNSDGSWRMVPMKVDDESGGCPTVMAPVFIRKDFSIRPPRAVDASKTLKRQRGVKDLKAKMDRPKLERQAGAKNLKAMLGASAGGDDNSRDYETLTSSYYQYLPRHELRISDPSSKDSKGKSADMRGQGLTASSDSDATTSSSSLSSSSSSSSAPPSGKNKKKML